MYHNLLCEFQEEYQSDLNTIESLQDGKSFPEYLPDWASDQELSGKVLTNFSFAGNLTHNVSTSFYLSALPPTM